MKAELSVKTNRAVFPQVSAASRVAGAGMSVPKCVIPNQYFESYLDTSDQWIRERTGIEQRYKADEKVGASELAEPASRQAIERAGLSPEEIDCIVLATVTPDYVFPSSACLLQRRLGITRGPAFDVNAACSGFVYALAAADAFIASGQCRHALVVGVDIYSTIVDPQDRTTCVLFGDGAGAVVLSAVCPPQEQRKSGYSCRVEGSGETLRGIYSYELGADGSGSDILFVPQGTASRPTAESLKKGEHFLRMEGREVFKIAVRKLSEISEKIVKDSGFSLEQVDFIATHQANIRIVTSMAKYLGVEMDRVLVNVNKYGNTSAASLPILLSEAERSGKLEPGNLLLVTAFGGGLTWGAMLLRW